jgi:putative sigma-54 modulation protein
VNYNRKRQPKVYQLFLNKKLFFKQVIKFIRMNYTENFDGIKLDVQAVDITINDDVQQEIRNMIERLRRHISEVNWADVYFEDKSGKSTDPKTVSVRLGIPGNDAFASDSGDNFMALLKSVEEKLRRQLEKR